MFGHMSYRYIVDQAEPITDLDPYSSQAIVGDQTAWALAFSIELPNLTGTAVVVGQVQGLDEAGNWYDLGDDLSVIWTGAAPGSHYICITSSVPSKLRIGFSSAAAFAATALIRLHSNKLIAGMTIG